MSLSTQLAEYVRACAAGIYIESHEHEDAIAEIAQLCRDENWQLACWDVANGLRNSQAAGPSEEQSSADPLAAIRSLAAMDPGEGAAILVLTNFHRFLNSAEIVQSLVHQIQQGKSTRRFVIILSPVVEIPVELEKLFVCLEHGLPTREQLEEIAQSIGTEEGELPDSREMSAVIDAAVGLTRYEAEAAFSLSLVCHGSLQPPAVWELKSQMLKKSGLVTLHRGSEQLEDLGGLNAVKSFCLRALQQPANRRQRAEARGILLLGVSGTGKSALAKGLGNAVARPTVDFDPGRLLGSLVGQTEGNIRQVLRLADAMAPCILFIDEVEKALSGVGSSGAGDSGVSARMFGTFLTWLNDHESDVFVVATCNDISKLPPEFAQSERFDGIFFLDVPTPDAKNAIWQRYLDYFELDADQQRPQDTDWTGAEIRSCCRLAALLDVPLLSAAHNVVPVARTAAEKVEALKQWASGRCLDAEKSGIYQYAKAKRSRRAVVKPSNN